MIFLQHKKFKQQLLFKDSIIEEQEEIINRMNYCDSVQNILLNKTEAQLIKNQEVIDSLNKSLKKSNKKSQMLKYLTIGGFSLSAILFPIIFIK